MPQSDQAIARRSQGLLRGLVPRRRHDLSGEELAKRWAIWQRHAADGDAQRLRELMAGRGLWPSALRPPAVLLEEPGWLPILAAVRHEAAQADPEASAHGVPFGAVLAPFVAVGRGLLLGSRPPLDGIADSALCYLEHGLLVRLSGISGPTLFHEFEPRRANNPLAALLGPAIATQAPHEAYRAFVAETLADRFHGLFDRYPVLARLLCRTVEAWVEAGAEFLTRLAADRAILADRFPGPAGRRLVAVGCGLSDAHAGGRTVLRASFDDGLALAYKPRAVDMEDGFGRVVAWLEERGLGQGHRLPGLVVRDGYGWMSWVESRPCADQAELDAFFRRIGGLFAIYDALGGSDLHFENIVAAGPHPVLIDTECLLHPRFEGPLSELVVPEVLTMGITPMYLTTPQGRLVNVGALGPLMGANALEEPTFVLPDTDWMQLLYQPKPHDLGHMARLGDGVAHPADHVHALAQGWREAWSLLLDRREALLSEDPGGLLEARGRWLARATWIYGILLHQSRAPSLLGDGIDQALLFEALRTDDQFLGAVADHERQVLADNDVPRFETVGDSLRPRDEKGREFALTFPETPHGRMARRLRTKTAESVEADLRLICRALSRPPRVSLPAGAPADAVACRHAALVAVADAVAARVDHRADGAAHVQTLGNLNGGEVLPAPASLALYDGALGIALFLVAAARVLDRDELAEHGRALLLPIRRTLTGRHGDGLLGAIGPGYGQGLAGLISGLHGCGELLDDRSLRAEARGLTRWTASALAHDPTGDLLGGAVGLGLALLRVGETEAARLCGQALLRRALDHGGGRLSWPFGGGPGLAGLSHGAAGQALLFAQLLRADGERDGADWRRALRGALAYEARLYDPEAANWRDLRDGASGFMNSWCHGAPGIALSRLGILQALGDDPCDCETELGNALATTAAGEAGRDDLCCGGCGRSLILGEAGRKLDRPDLVAQSQGLLDACLGKAGERGQFALWHAGLPITTGDLTLFKGLAGVGYALARDVQRDGLPLLLLP